MISSNRTNGSIFLVLFSALAILGILGVALTSFVKGPMTSAVKMTRNNTAQTQMAIAAQSTIMAAANLGATGDCDNDGFMEPVEWRVDATKPNPTGGNLIPTNIGAPVTDPWGTDYGYCVWDDGPVLLNAACQLNTPGTNKRLAGTNQKNYPVVAIISAGPNKAFDTTCRTFAAADTNSNGTLSDAGDFALAQKNTDASDDIIFTYTYEEATAASGGLWSLKSSDQTTATISKSIEATAAKFSGTSMMSSAGGFSSIPDCTGLGSARYADAASGHCYYYISTTDTWANQQAACATNGAYLAVISSAAENTIVLNLGTNTTTKWIGANDSLVPGEWRWKFGELSGQMFWLGTNTGVAQNSLYNNWNTASWPANSQCATLATGGSWGSLTCTNLRYAVCEKAPMVASVEFASGLKLADNTSVPTCNTTNTGIIRRLASSVQICDGTSWITQGGSLGLDDLTDAIANYVKNNIFIGQNVGNTTITGGGNTLLGADAASGSVMTVASGNTGMGYNNFLSLKSGNYNTAFGYNSASTGVISNNTTAFGARSCYALGTGAGVDNNTCVGYASLGGAASIGATAAGALSGAVNIGATNLTAVGFSALHLNTTGTDNTAIGVLALDQNTTGTDNTAMGYNALTANVTGTNNTAFGNEALKAAKTNSSTAVGSQALYTLGSGDANIAIGYQALYTANNTVNTTPNIAIGYNAMKAATVPASTIAIGSNALAVPTTASNSVAIGRDAMKSRTGAGIIAIGSNAASSSGSSVDSIAIGYGAGASTLWDDGFLAIGYNAAPISTSYPIVVGYEAGLSMTGGTNNTAAGYQALRSIGSGTDNVAFGYQALKANVSSTGNTAGGYLALTNTTGANNTGVGYRALYTNTTGGNNVAIGVDALYKNTSGGTNIGVGYQAGYNNSTSNLIAIGNQAGFSNTSGARNVAIGASSLYSNTTTTDSTAIGKSALYGMTGNYGTAAGFSAGGGAAGAAIFKTALGSLALYNHTAAGGTGVGYAAGYKLGSTTNNTAVGSLANGNTAGASTNFSTALGYQAAYNGPAIAAGAYTLYNTTSASLNNVAIGMRALYGKTSGTNNTAIGYGAASTGNGNNTTTIGYLAPMGADNSVRLGSSTITLIEGKVAFTNPSDRRLKKDITPSDLGLDFILGLKPVSYRLKQGNGRLDYGFLAQDIEASLDGRITNMITRQENAMKTYQMRSNDLIAPLVKAIQERQIKIQNLKRQIENLKNEPINCEGVR